MCSVATPLHSLYQWFSTGAHASTQNRRQKVCGRGGALHSKFHNSIDLQCFIFLFGGLGACLAAKPTKAPRGDRTASTGGINKFPGWREPSRVLENFPCKNFFNGKVFRPVYLFKVRGAWNKLQLFKGGVVEKGSEQLIYMNWIDRYARVDEGVAIESYRIDRLFFEIDLVLLESFEQGLLQSIRTWLVCSCVRSSWNENSTKKAEVSLQKPN